MCSRSASSLHTADAGESSSGTGTAEAAQPAELDSRPEAITLSIENLLKWVLDGRIRVPRFQRSLKWDATDIRLLFDSIYRGYPVGTLLFWKRPAEAAVIELGPVHIDAPMRQDALWVVDGQQRIASLTGVLAGRYDDVGDKHALYFDLAGDGAAFVHASKTHAPQSSWLPLGRVLDSQALMEWLYDRPELEREAVSRAIRLGKRVREYQVPAYVVETQDEAPLRTIFHRVNSHGKSLKKAEVFEALHGGDAPEPSGLPAMADALATTGFGRIDEDLLLKALLAVEGKDTARNAEAQLAADQIPQARARTLKALERAIVFVQGRAGIPHLGLMPYRLPLVTLARFFAMHPEPASRSLVLIARWLWRGAINGRHQGNTVATRRTLQAIGADEDEAVQNLLHDVGDEPDHHPVELTPFNFRYARSKLQVLALWALGPRHIETGAALRVHELMASRSPPTRRVKAADADAPQLASGLSNYLLHPPLSKGLRRLLAAQRDPDILASHAISPAAHAALADGDFVGFLTAREQTLLPHVESFLAARAEWQASDRPPLSALVIED
ncbi:GmrSD restriction endonuclease domain-containing protein [Haliangium sp.]|uniref:DUF262 domain-containing protein n=1 Tax=Haliangium sp. TaxID=2663208 RepID=UPI003D0992DD